jgi:hypothetical protein
MIVAGEASGDLHGGNLIREMRRINPRISFYGVGGKSMRAEGVELQADAADMAVVGLTEVFFKLGKILLVMRRLKLAANSRPTLSFSSTIRTSTSPSPVPPGGAGSRSSTTSVRRCGLGERAGSIPSGNPWIGWPLSYPSRRTFTGRPAWMSPLSNPLLDEVKTKSKDGALKRSRAKAITVVFFPAAANPEVAGFPEMLGAAGYHG